MKFLCLDAGDTTDPSVFSIETLENIYKQSHVETPVQYITVYLRCPVLGAAFPSTIQALFETCFSDGDPKTRKYLFFWKGRVFLEKKRPLPGMPATVDRMACFSKKKRPLPGMPETLVRACFHNKSKTQWILTTLFFPKRYTRQNDATNVLYPTPISFFNSLTKLIHFEGNRQTSILCGLVFH